MLSSVTHLENKKKAEVLSISESKFYLGDLSNHLGIFYDTQVQMLQLYQLLSALF